MSQLRGDVISEGAKEKEVLEKIRCFNSTPPIWPDFEAGSCQPAASQENIGEERDWWKETFLLGQWQLTPGTDEMESGGGPRLFLGDVSMILCTALASPLTSPPKYMG